MKKKKVLSMGDRAESKASTHVIIDLDRHPPNPLKEYDQVFFLHSNIEDFSGNENDKDYQNPLVEIEDEDGYGTGEYRPKDGVIAFAVSAYIHSGIALKLGTIMCFFGDTVLPGCRCGCDTTPNAGFMWTTKERFEKMCGTWMEIWDEEAQVRRMAKDEEEFRKYLEELADGELELFQKYLDGECFGYREEIRKPFKKVYPDGTEEDDCDWEDGDSCWGYYVDSIDDIEFSKDEDVDVFDDTGHFVGDEWTIPELVIVHPETKLYLRAESSRLGGNLTAPAIWTKELSEAMVFHHWNCAYNAFVDGDKRLWNVFGDYENVRQTKIIIDKDELK